MPMLHRVVMNVIHVPLEIELIPNRVLPESLLPHAAKTLGALTRGHVCFQPPFSRIPPCEVLFDLTPPGGKVVVTSR
jgi:hypothetical protein